MSKYQDLNITMKPHPFTGDLMVKEDTESLKRAVMNIVLLNYYEKPFNPAVGTSVIGFLFANAGPAEKILLQISITNALAKFEPRVQVLSVEAEVDSNNQSISVRIFFTPLNSSIPVEVQFFLNRIR